MCIASPARSSLAEGQPNDVGRRVASHMRAGGGGGLLRLFRAGDGLLVAGQSTVLAALDSRGI